MVLLAGSSTRGAFTVSVAPAVVLLLEIEIEPLFPSSSELPPTVPMVKAEGDATLPKAMLPIPSDVALPAVELMAMVVELLVRNVAVSVFVMELSAPGKVAAPVLQLFSAPAASQMPFVGVAFQVPLAALAEWLADNPKAAAIARAMELEVR